MSRWRFFLQYALNRLRYGGQQMLIALLAVAFGIMSLVSMISVADAIDRALQVEPRQILGGEILMYRPEGAVTVSDFEILERLQAEGLIGAFSPVSEAPSLLMRTQATGQARYFQVGVGIEPNTYPIAGNLTIQDPFNASVSELLQEPATALITRDMALLYGIAVGDRLWLAQNDGTALAFPVTVTGIVSDTPQHKGQRIYYNLNTAQALFAQEDIFGYAVMQTDNIEGAAQRLTAEGWELQRADGEFPPPATAITFFNFMLRGAGILGLIVGGIGIANTMQVLLARRRQEVGILKALGCSQGDMLAIFLFEVGLLGMVGSTVGAVLAVGIGQLITTLFANSSTVLITWQFDAFLTIGGILTGVFTTILFALAAIVRTSRIRPTVIFRESNHGSHNSRQWLETLGTYALASIPFAAIAIWIMGSVLEGVGVLLFALVSLVVLCLIFGVLTWLLLRLLPSFGINLLEMARNTMRKRIFSMLLAMIALFVGIFTVGFAITVIQISADEFTIRQSGPEPYPLLVHMKAEEVAPITARLQALGVEAQEFRYTYRVGEFLNSLQTGWNNVVQVRDVPWDIEIIEGSPFESGEYGLYVSEESPLALGSKVDLEFADGVKRTVPVIGRYRYTIASAHIDNIRVPLMSRTTLEQLKVAPPLYVTVYAKVAEAEADSIALQIGEAFADAMTVTVTQTNAEVNRTFLNLLGFALAMAGLALVAGVMLIANVVSLAMIERRYEIGVMKAVGYTRKDVSTLFALEYGLVGLMVSLMAIVGVQGVLTWISLTQSTPTVLAMHPLTGVLIGVLGIVLTVATALFTAWKPLGSRPLLILSERAL